MAGHPVPDVPRAGSTVLIFADSITSALQHPEAARLAELAHGKLVLEVGSEYGRSTIALASTAHRVHAVDWHRGDGMSGWKDSLPEFLENLSKYKVRDKVTVHLGTWQEVAPVMGAYRFDLAFIDGDHSEEAVKRDFELAVRVTKMDGRFVFHDADQEQVWRAVTKVAAYYRMPSRRGVGSLAEVLAERTTGWFDDEI